MESASGIKETGEQSTVVTSPMKPCEGCGKPTRIKCSNYKCFINWSESHKYNNLCYVALREVGDHAEGELMLMAILVGVELVQPAEYSLYRPLVSADSTYI